MAFAKSAKDILISNDFLEAREKAGKYISYEFQDYGYRLASDLGDVQHKGIYMKLAKTIDRTLLEQAAAFALGYFDEPNKGKIFMWKVQQLRRMSQQKQDMRNTDHDFVMQKMSEITDELADVFAAAQKRDMNDQLQAELTAFAQSLLAKFEVAPDKLRLLVLGCGIGLEAAAFAALGIRVFGLDISRKLVVRAKKLCGKTMTRKVNPLNNVYKQGYFHGVFVPNWFWQIVPTAAELDYIKMIDGLLKPNGLKSANVKLSEQANEGWEKFTWNEIEYIRFAKKQV